MEELENEELNRELCALAVDDMFESWSLFIELKHETKLQKSRGGTQSHVEGQIVSCESLAAKQIHVPTWAPLVIIKIHTC